MTKSRSIALLLSMLLFGSVSLQAAEGASFAHMRAERQARDKAAQDSTKSSNAVWWIAGGVALLLGGAYWRGAPAAGQGARQQPMETGDASDTPTGDSQVKPCCQGKKTGGEMKKVD
jgi:hypothetical protein